MVKYPQNRFRTIMTYEEGEYQVIIKKKLDHNGYMREYSDAHRERIRARRRVNYAMNLNGQREKAIARHRKNRKKPIDG